jgi:dihydrodipicolinate synthase/N-acetylneuraminate lyase
MEDKMTKNSTELGGMLVALVTPFTDDGAQVDGDRLVNHVDELIHAGVHGLVPNGSTGEFTALSDDERRTVVELCVKAADGRVPVVAGTGALTTAATVEFSRHAADVGADAVMVVPPFYDALSAPELKKHLQLVHEGCGLPIVYYNIPAVTGLRLSAAELAGLGEVPGVRYMKDTSGDAVALSELLIKHRDAITTFNGWDTLTFLGIASGAKGSVWGAANIFPELAVELWDTVAIRKDLDAGRALWARLWPLCDFLEARGYAAAVKAGMQLVGRGAGPVRAPFDSLSASDIDEFAGLLRAAGLPTG